MHPLRPSIRGVARRPVRQVVPGRPSPSSPCTRPVTSRSPPRQQEPLDDDWATETEAFAGHPIYADDAVTETEPHGFEAAADHPDLDAISQRLASLEEKLESVLVRSAETLPSDAILDRMDELKGQYQRVAEEIARLEVIEDNLARLIDEVAGRNTDNTLLAESVAERVVSQMSGHGQPADQAQAQGYERLEGIEHLLSSFVTDRQTEDSATQQLLVSIRTIVETLDTRVGVIEHEIQQATAGEPPMAEAATPLREPHGAAQASSAEDTSYEIGPEAYASFDEAETIDEAQAPAEPMPKVAARRAVLQPPAAAASRSRRRAPAVAARATHRVGAPGRQGGRQASPTEGKARPGACRERVAARSKAASPRPPRSATGPPASPSTRRAHDRS